MSQLEVDKIIPQSGTTLTIGDSGDTISFAEGTNLGIDTNTLVIDSTNNRVGIKNASPTVELDVTGSVAVSGTVTATSFVGDGSSLTGVSSVGGATGVDFNDSVKARFGTGNDLEIYHDGTHSYISDQGTGQLRFLAENFQVRDAGNTSTMIYATPNSSVQLYHNNSTKLETTSTGVDVTGTVTADGLNVSGTGNFDNNVNIENSSGYASLEMGGSSGAYIDFKAPFSDDYDARIWNNGSTLQINNKNSGAIDLMTANTVRMKVDSSGHFVPNVSNTYDLGSSSLVWRNIYTSDFHMSNEGLDKGNDIDGTKGSWTFQEGEENLYLINNKNGKKYKFNLTEIE